MLGEVRGTDGMIGGMMAKGSDLQNAGTSTAIFSSGYASAGGFRLTKGNLWQAAIVFAVRRLIQPTWLNDRDQFLQPSEPLTDEFKSDCLIWMLLNGSNRCGGGGSGRPSGMANKWSLTNHFIPFTESEVGASRAV